MAHKGGCHGCTSSPGRGRERIRHPQGGRCIDRGYGRLGLWLGLSGTEKTTITKSEYDRYGESCYMHKPMVFISALSAKNWIEIQKEFRQIWIERNPRGILVSVGLLPWPIHLDTMGLGVDVHGHLRAVFDIRLHFGP